MQNEFNKVVKEYVDLKSELFKKFQEIKNYEYKLELFGIGQYGDFYELCEVELEIYDNLKFIYEDQDVEEEEFVNYKIINYHKFLGEGESK